MKLINNWRGGCVQLHESVVDSFWLPSISSLNHLGRTISVGTTGLVVRFIFCLINRDVCFQKSNFKLRFFWEMSCMYLINTETIFLF